MADNLNQTLIYVASFMGMLVLLGVFAGVLHRKHKQDTMERQAWLEAARQRQQQVIDENLPPFYADHTRDPVVLEDQIPLEVIIGMPLERVAEDHHHIHTDIHTSSRSALGVTMTPLPSPSSPPGTLQQHSQITLTTTSTITRARALSAATTTTTSQSGPADASVVIIPPITLPGARESTLEYEDLTNLPPPPSYDAPNLVVESHLTRALAQGQDESAQVETTPRYSAEFPSHIAHERHLDNYRRSRALSDATVRPPLPQILQSAMTNEPPAAMTAV
ncbi:hypothetical protein BGZ83_007267 [Gryganskiella cystojenkinii]|nr:hypothetical protein BGZ83_007267 [Gryganskiella cystojenkinii]